MDDLPLFGFASLWSSIFRHENVCRLGVAMDDESLVGVVNNHDRQRSPTTFLCGLAPGVVHQNLAHPPGGNGEEVSTILQKTTGAAGSGLYAGQNCRLALANAPLGSI